MEPNPPGFALARAGDAAAAGAAGSEHRANMRKNAIERQKLETDAGVLCDAGPERHEWQLDSGHATI